MKKSPPFPHLLKGKGRRRNDVVRPTVMEGRTHEIILLEKNRDLIPKRKSDTLITLRNVRLRKG